MITLNEEGETKREMGKKGRREESGERREMNASDFFKNKIIKPLNVVSCFPLQFNENCPKLVLFNAIPEHVSFSFREKKIKTAKSHLARTYPKFHVCL